MFNFIENASLLVGPYDYHFYVNVMVNKSVQVKDTHQYSYYRMGGYEYSVHACVRAWMACTDVGGMGDTEQREKGFKTTGSTTIIT